MISVGLIIRDDHGAGDVKAAKLRAPSKTVNERKRPPAFDVCVEMISRFEWIVWTNVARAVDCLLQGRTWSGLPREVRIYLHHGV
jgi:hypothetical protein